MVAEIKVMPHLDREADIFFVDRIGKFGSKTFECGSLFEASIKAEEIVKEDNVLFVYIWN